MLGSSLRAAFRGAAARASAELNKSAAGALAAGRQHAAPFSFAAGAAAAAAAAAPRACQSGASAVGASVFRQQQQLMTSFARRGVQTSASTPSPGLMGAIMAFPKAQPFAFNIMIATVKTSIADVITQKAIEQREQIDWTRNAVFVVFGCVYLGGFQYWLQVNMFRKWFPTMDRFANQSFAAKLKDTAGLIDTAKQVLFDVFIHLPLMYFPTFYAVKESVMGTSWSPVDWVKDGCTKYYNNFQKDFTAMFTLWFPADCVIFAVPIYLRLPVRHVVSLGWTSYLSFLRGSKQEETPKK